MNFRFWKGVSIAWLCAFVILFLGRLFTSWGFLGFQDFGAAFDWKVQLPFTLALALTLFFAMYLMAAFLEKLARVRILNPVKFGLQFGAFYSLPILLYFLGVFFDDRFRGIEQSFLYDRTFLFGAVSDVVISLAAFATAAWVYQKMDPAPLVRGGQNKEYLAARAKR